MRGVLAKGIYCGVATNPQCDPILEQILEKVNAWILHEGEVS